MIGWCALIRDVRIINIPGDPASKSFGFGKIVKSVYVMPEASKSCFR
jgi:hypothetical protein